MVESNDQNDVLDPEYGEMDREQLVRIAEEFRQAWFLSLAVLLLRNDLRVEMSQEELEKARLLVISKDLSQDGETIIFTATVMGDENAGSEY